MTQIKQLSFWAKQNKGASRFLIVLAFMIMNFLGIVTGFLFNSLSVNFSSLVLLFTILVFLLAWWKYPIKKVNASPNEKNRSYIFQKTCDLILIGSTFVMFVYFGNRQISPVNYFVFTASSASSLSHSKDSSNTYKSIEEFKKMMKDENGKTLKLKERKKLLKKQIREIRNADNLSSSGKVFLIILCVLLAVVLAYGVAGIACSLSCSGSEGAAVVVAILGLAGIVLLTFFLIRGIVRKSKKEKAKEVKPATELPATKSN
jgi:membrane protein implicated in regulation of membrane protease activity